MRGASRAALVAAAGLILPGAAPPQATLTVTDHLGVSQQEETIAVYFAGVLAGTLHVDATHPDDSFTAIVPDIEKLSFTLCGRLLRRQPNGPATTYPIDNGGIITRYQDASLDAITLGDVLFTLEDTAGVATTTTQRGPACTAAVS